MYRLGHVAVHVLPCLMAWAVPPPGLGFPHVAYAYVLYVTWALCVSRGTMLLDDCYVPLPAHVWHISSSAGVVGMLVFAGVHTSP